MQNKREEKKFFFERVWAKFDLTVSENNDRFLGLRWSKQKWWQSTKDMDTVPEVCITAYTCHVLKSLVIYFLEHS